MLDGLFVVSIIGSCVQAIKKSFEPNVPVENWENKQAYYQDVVDGVSIKQRMKNMENGKYKSYHTNYNKTKYPEPHRDKDGKIIVENCLLYEQDLKQYGAVQTMKWTKQGKYNLEGEELKKEKERIRKKYDYLYRL